MLEEKVAPGLLPVDITGSIVENSVQTTWWVSVLASARTMVKRGVASPTLRQDTGRACFTAHWGRGGGYSVFYLPVSLLACWFTVFLHVLVFSASVYRDLDCITKHQAQYTKEIIKRFLPADDNITHSVPADSAGHLVNYQCAKSDEDRVYMRYIPYRQVVGSLLKLALCTRVVACGSRP